MEIRIVLSAAAIGVMLLGCESLPERSPLTGTKWEVVNLHGQALIRTRKPLTAEFLPNGRLTGSGGINTFETGVEIRGKRISVHEEMSKTLIGSTVPALEEQESAYLTAIGRTRSWFIDDGDLLHLCGADGGELATLKRVSR